jgi:RNA polymerase sigma factor (sigma-70 family)
VSLLSDFIDESSIESVERKLDIEQALNKLDEREREILSLSLYGYSQQEIGARVGYSQRNISNVLEKIAKQLQNVA